MGWLPTLVTSAAAAALVLTATLSLVSWFTDPAATPVATERVAVEPLPIVRRSEIVLARARALYLDGHLRDALRALDRIDSADPMRPDADRLRGDVQRALIAASSGTPLAPPGAVRP